MRERIYHPFGQRISKIINDLYVIKYQGFTCILLTPIQPCKDGPDWWVVYQPLDFKIGNKFGTKEELTELCRLAKELGIKVVQDIVLRHLAGVNNGDLIPNECASEVIKNNPNFWTGAENSTDYYNRYCITDKAYGMPMLNYNDWRLQDIYISFIRELRSCGIGGVRVDMGKHFALPEEGHDFWPRVFNEFSDLFNFAECLGCTREWLDKYTRYMNVVSDCRDPSDMSKLVASFMTHDTELNKPYITSHMDDEMIVREWEYLLRDYPISHVMFFVREGSNLWQSEAIRKINLGLDIQRVG